MSETFRLRFRIPSKLSAMATVRHKLEKFIAASSLDLGEDASLEVTLALDEATSNIVRHAYCDEDGNAREGFIDVEYAQEKEDLLIRLWDDGNPCDRISMVGLPHSTPGESGMGSAMIRSIMSEVRFERTKDGRNLLEMRRRPGGSTWSFADMTGE